MRILTPVPGLASSDFALWIIQLVSGAGARADRRVGDVLHRQPAGVPDAHAVPATVTDELTVENATVGVLPIDQPSRGVCGPRPSR